MMDEIIRALKLSLKWDKESINDAIKFLQHYGFKDVDKTMNYELIHTYLIEFALTRAELLLKVCQA